MNDRSAIKPTLVWVLIVLQALLGLGALVSGLMLVLAPDGSLLQLPLEVMQGSPFPDFLIPGVILFIFLGIFPCFIAYSVWKQPGWEFPDKFNPFREQHWSWAGSLCSALIVIIFLGVELIWVEYSTLHAIYFSWAVLLFILSLATRDYFDIPEKS